MAIRKIVKIDEEKCNGCGQCVPGCAEGALQIIDGKARLVKESYCDGLGACLGECPQGAITIEERNADAFDEAAVAERLGHAPAATGSAKTAPAQTASKAHAPSGGCPSSGMAALLAGGPPPAAGHGGGGGCPGSRMMQLRRQGPAAGHDAQKNDSAPAGVGVQSELSHWPVQLALVPIEAPFYHETELVLAADCVSYALADFHGRFLKGGRALAIACPKLDDVGPYVDKLAEILRRNAIRGLVLVHMEVPCCGGIVRLAEEAARRSGRTLPVRDVVVSVGGEILSDNLRVVGA